MSPTGLVPPAARRDRRGEWALPVALVALAALSLAAGAARLVGVAGGPALLPPDDRFSGFPAALVLHVLSAAVFALLGAVQLAPAWRSRHPAWHRRSGRVTAAAGLSVAVSAVWLTLGYAPQPGTGPLLLVLRLVFAPATAVCLLLGVAAVRRGDVCGHRAWMVRAYALGLAAGTQVLTEGVTEAVLGGGETRLDLAKGSGWVINLAIAEWALRRPGRQRPEHPPRATQAAAGSTRTST